MHRPYPIERLERLTRGHVETLAQLRAVLGPAAGRSMERWWSDLGRGGAATTASGGRARVSVTRVWCAGSDELPRIVSRCTAAFALAGSGGRRALLTLDDTCAGAVVSALLGTPGTTPLGGHVTEGERGLLLYALSALLDQLDAPAPWSLLAEAPAPAALELEGALAVEARVDLGPAVGLAHLCLGPSLAGGGARRLEPRLLRERSGRLAGQRCGVGLAVAALRVPAQQLDGLGEGDVLIAHGLPSPAAATTGVLHVAAGGFHASVTGARVEITGRFVPGALEELMEHGQDEQVPTDTERGDAATIAEHLPVDLVVEVARVQLTGAQVLQLEPGDVLTLQRPVSSSVELRVGGRLVARGELVDVEGETGVRLTEVYD